MAGGSRTQGSWSSRPLLWFRSQTVPSAPWDRAVNMATRSGREGGVGRHRKTNPEALRLASTAKPSQADPDASLPDLGPLKPTPVYNSYWRFAAERQNVFFRRLEGRPPPWTHDPVIRAHKFTNAYRASDRVSQYLIRRVIYRADLPDDPAEVVFRIL